MSDVRSEPFFIEAFPEYCTRVIHGSTPNVPLCLSGQVRPGYYDDNPLAPPLGKAVQHLLLHNEEGEQGVFEEPLLRPKQTTMTFTILGLPQSNHEFNRFCLLTLSLLIDNLKYPNNLHQIIVRGKDSRLSDHLPWIATHLGFNPAIISNRTYTPGFFPTTTQSSKNPSLDAGILSLIQQFRTYWATKSLSAEERPTHALEPLSMVYG